MGSARTFTFLLWLFSGAVAFAGGDTGGGNVVVCLEPSTGAFTYRLLDYYEAEILMPDLEPELGGGKTELERVEYVLKRLEIVDKVRANKYRKTAALFFGETRFVDSVILPDIKDHDYVPLKKHCEIQQLAVQYLSKFPEAKKYTVRRDYWNHLSLTDRAGLILHEIIYEEALSAGQKNSRNTRYVNALISSKKPEKMDFATYNQRLTLAGFSVVSSKSQDNWDWAEDPINLVATERQPFIFNLKPMILESDPGAKMGPNDFELISGPSWLKLSSGTVHGFPMVPGEYPAVVRAIDVSKHTADVRITIEVQEATTSYLPHAVRSAPYKFILGFRCSGIKVSKISGPDWVTVLSATDGIVLSGTPSEADLGRTRLVLRSECTYVRQSKELLPDGSVLMKPVPEIEVSKDEYHLTVTGPKKGALVLKQLPVLRLTMVPSDRRCIGTLIGPRVVVSAAGCASSGLGTFPYDGKFYKVHFTASPFFASDRHNISLGLTDEDVSGAPFSIGGKTRSGDAVNTVLFDSTVPREFLRRISSEVTHLHSFQLVHEEPSGTAITQWDNIGAPVFDYAMKKLVAVSSAVSIGPRGMDGPGNMNQAILLSDILSQKFLKHFATQNSVEICGLNKTCN